MNRRNFVLSGLTAPLVMATSKPDSSQQSLTDNEVRTAFPGAKKHVYLNAAGMMPLGIFAQDGVHKYLEFQQPSTQQGDYVGTMWSDIRGLFAALVGARQAEIGLVSCTKAGEQIALDSVDAIKPGGNIVTNDLHFSGSLHNLVGLQKAGRDVRIVRAKNWYVTLEDMQEAIDSKTSLVTISLVSNINGRLEDIRALTEFAHRHGALVFADIIQAAGIVPIDVHAMGIDMAACSSYKWLYGVYGAGFLFVRQSLQGGSIPDRLYPGSVKRNYLPWVTEADAGSDEFGFHVVDDATRYQAGHPSYIGYCAAYEGLRFLKTIGVEKALRHSVALNDVLRSNLDDKKYQCISPDMNRSPIATFTLQQPKQVAQRLKDADIVVSISDNRMRVSPAIYNIEDDMLKLATVLNGT